MPSDNSDDFDGESVKKKKKSPKKSKVERLSKSDPLKSSKTPDSDSDEEIKPKTSNVSKGKLKKSKQTSNTDSDSDSKPSSHMNNVTNSKTAQKQGQSWLE